MSLYVQPPKQISTTRPLKYLLNKQMNSNAKDMVALLSLHVKGTSRVAKINEYHINCLMNGLSLGLFLCWILWVFFGKRTF